MNKISMMILNKNFKVIKYINGNHHNFFITILNVQRFKNFILLRNQNGIYISLLKMMMINMNLKIKIKYMFI